MHLNIIQVSIMLETAYSYLLNFELGNGMAKFMTPNAMDLVIPKLIQSFDFFPLYTPVRASSMQSKSDKHVKSCQHSVSIVHRFYVVNVFNEEINLQMIKSEWSGVDREKVKILRLFCESLLFEKQCMTFRGNANTFFMASYFHIFSTQFILFPSLMKMIYFYAIVIVFPLSNLLYFSDLSCFNGAFEIQDTS